eukprot:CAMPEP_0203818048 /NCGR_PEP_ID=MMETSP0115-20131106/29841_1 /ASSEMBLY_ACC=CAM_ASM_000227 /TAXON_ID=33651 /ORGANISM="Bicosoecid sp, Strain ms1" /LENGTH=318 /DNA_ID=CAMNT_0050727005 /DNA_START=22 /DNA_END=979 /DNA_ORIENTATION=-
MGGVSGVPADPGLSPTEVACGLAWKTSVEREWRWGDRVTRLDVAHASRYELLLWSSTFYDVCRGRGIDTEFLFQSESVRDLPLCMSYDAPMPTDDRTLSRMFARGDPRNLQAVAAWNACRMLLINRFGMPEWVSGYAIDKGLRRHAALARRNKHQPEPLKPSRQGRHRESSRSVIGVTPCPTQDDEPSLEESPLHATPKAKWGERGGRLALRALDRPLAALRQLLPHSGVRGGPPRATAGTYASYSLSNTIPRPRAARAPSRRPPAPTPPAQAKASAVAGLAAAADASFGRVNHADAAGSCVALGDARLRRPSGALTL